MFFDFLRASLGLRFNPNRATLLRPDGTRPKEQRGEACRVQEFSKISVHSSQPVVVVVRHGPSTYPRSTPGSHDWIRQGLKSTRASEREAFDATLPCCHMEMDLYSNPQLCPIRIGQQIDFVKDLNFLDKLPTPFNDQRVLNEHNQSESAIEPNVG